MYALLGRFVGIDKFFLTNTKFCEREHTLILTLAFFCLLQPVFLTLTVKISSFKVPFIFSALVFSVYVTALQSGHTAYSDFLLIPLLVKHHIDRITFAP